MRVDNAGRAALYDKKHYILPSRARRVWDRARSAAQTLYIYGMTGFGKTALICSLTENESVIYVSALNLEPEDLTVPTGRRVKTVILDDLSHLPEHPQFETLSAQLSELSAREDIWLVLCGRCRVPGWLMPTRVRDSFRLLEEEDLILEPEAALDLYRSYELSLSPEAYARYRSYTHGIGLGERVLALRLLADDPVTDATIRSAQEDVWSYIWTRVYDHWPQELSTAVMALSVVDRFTVELARMITGRSDVEPLLEHMQAAGNFLIRHDDGPVPVYEIRPLARTSILYRLKVCRTEREQHYFYYNAGLYYEMHDDLLTAVKYYELSGDTERIRSVLIRNAHRDPGSGHYYELREHYLRLPEEQILKDPVLIYALSLLQSILMHIEESEQWYDQLKRYAETHKDPERHEANSLLLQLDIALPHRGSVDLIKLLMHAGTLLRRRDAVLSDFCITSNLPSQMNGGKDFCEWSRNDNQLASWIGKTVSFVLGKHGNALVDLALAESYLEKGGDSVQILSRIATGRMKADTIGALEQIFVADGLLAWMHILAGKADEAETVLTTFRVKAEQAGRTKLLPNIDAFLTRTRLYLGDADYADTWFLQGPEEQIAFNTFDRFRYLTKVRVHLLFGRCAAALTLLEKLLFYAERMHRTYVGMECRLLQAITLYRMGNPGWDEPLCQCLTQAADYHFVRLISREGAAVLPLLEQTGYDSRDTEYFRTVLSEVADMAHAYPAYLGGSEQAQLFAENALQILRYQAEGLSTSAIADRLHISEGTVKYHNQENYRKLGVHDKVSAVVEAKRRGLI